MQILSTALCDVKVVRPQRHCDPRGWFAEMFNASQFAAAGLPHTFVQDNQSFSVHGVIRGLHYQLRRPQGKLVRVLRGNIWDVAVDMRRHSPEFGRWSAFELGSGAVDSASDILWIPGGYAHGFLVLSDSAEVLYKVTDTYHPDGERTVLWNDPDLAIDWPLDRLAAPPILSAKDATASRFAAAEAFDTI